MKVKFLGTAAAEGWPGVFCECENCRRAREAGGKNIRTRSSLLLNDIYKVDLPPDTYLHVLKYGLNLAEIEHIFITHSHQDHFYFEELNMRRPPFAHIAEGRVTTIYGNDKVGDAIASMVENPGYRLRFRRCEPFRSFTAGDMKVTPMRADHAYDQVAMFYIFEYLPEGKTVLVGFDTGWYPPDTWEALSQFRLDMAIFDCTNGAREGRRGHMGISAVVELKVELEKMGVLTPDSLCFATHFSHNGGLLHHQLEEALGPYGIQPAYDGLEVEL